MKEQSARQIMTNPKQTPLKQRIVSGNQTLYLTQSTDPQDNDTIILSPNYNSRFQGKGNIYQLPFHTNFNEPIKVPQPFPKILRNTNSDSLHQAHDPVSQTLPLNQTRNSLIQIQDRVHSGTRRDANVLLPTLNIAEHLISTGIASQFYQVKSHKASTHQTFVAPTPQPSYYGTHMTPAVRLSQTLSEALASDLNSPITKKQSNQVSKPIAGGPLSDLLITTHSQFCKYPDEMRFAQDSTLSAVERFNLNLSQVPMHPQSLPKNPKGRKLGADPNYSRQYEIHKSKQAEYQTIQEQVLGNVQLAPPIAPLFPVHSQMQKVVRSPKPPTHKRPFLKAGQAGQTSQTVTSVLQSKGSSRTEEELKQLNGVKIQKHLEIVAESKLLSHQGHIQKNHIQCPCVNLGYTFRKNVSTMTNRKYQEGVSTRLMVARETLKNQSRTKLPLLIVNLDGVVGYFDEQKTYCLRSNALNHLIALSANFKVVAVCTGQTKRCVKRLCSQLAERDGQRPAMVFDAVYLLRKLPKDRTNLTHAMLDFYDEELELAQYCEKSVIVLSPDKLKHGFTSIREMDMRELFVIDSFHFQGAKTPLILRVMHARLRHHNCVLFDLCYQVLITLLILSKQDYNDGKLMLQAIQAQSSERGDPDQELNQLWSSGRIANELLPQRAKMIQQQIEKTHSARFVMRQPEEPLDLMKGFAILQQDLNHKKLDWIQVYLNDFVIPVPVVAQVAFTNQQVISRAVQPTGQRYTQTHRMPEALRSELQAQLQDNEKTQKYTRKFRATYWANHVIDEDLFKLIGKEAHKSEQMTKVAHIMKQRAAAPKVCQPIEDSESEEEEAPSVDSELAEYDCNIPEMTYQIVQLRQKWAPDGKHRDKVYKLDCKSSATKPLMQFCVDMMCKKQQLSMYQTTQQEHLKGAQVYQIDSQIQQLHTWIDSQQRPRVEGKEAYNYD